MIRKNLLKATLITTIIATILTTSACGKKTASNTADNTKPQATVSAETKSVAAKELTKTSLVSFDYTDEAGNTYTLEGKAVANESGDAVIEVTDAKGNKVTFTGKAKTVDGKLSVSDIAVKDAGTLVKADGSEIKVSTGSTVADASESNEGESNTDIVASDDVREEVETAKKEESVIEAAREEVTKAEESVKTDDENNNDKNNDTIIADNENNGGNENTGNNNTGDSENTGDNNASDSNNTPTPSEPEETPTTPSEPDTEPVETPTQKPQEELHPGQPGYVKGTPIGAYLYSGMEGQIPYDILVEYSKGELSAEQAEAKLLSKLGRNNPVEGCVTYEAGYSSLPEDVYILKCHFWVEEAVAGGSMQEAYYTDYTFGYPGFQQGEGVLNLDSMLAYHCAYVVLPITM